MLLDLVLPPKFNACITLYRFEVRFSGLFKIIYLNYIKLSIAIALLASEILRAHLNFIEVMAVLICVFK
jgi:hypothetical protein